MTTAELWALPDREWARRKRWSPQYREFFERQGGICAICRQPSTKTLALNHCPKTGKGRGLLCTKCNAALHWHELLKTREAWMKDAETFIENWGVKSG
jgi:hypothetical protein